MRMLKASCKKRSVSSAYMRAPAPKVARISEQIQIVDSMQDSDTEDAQSEYYDSVSADLSDDDCDYDCY